MNEAIKKLGLGKKFQVPKIFQIFFILIQINIGFQNLKKGIFFAHAM